MRMDGEVLPRRSRRGLGLRDLSEHEDIDTVGGLVLKLLERQPAVGDTVTIGNFRVTVGGRRWLPHHAGPSGEKSPEP